eukprot:scaffold134719_cov36-Prasinocladus_malaysianus.AAC.1
MFQGVSNNQLNPSVGPLSPVVRVNLTVSSIQVTVSLVISDIHLVAIFGRRKCRGCGREMGVLSAGLPGRI